MKSVSGSNAYNHFAEFDRHLASLQEELSTIDTSLSGEVAALRKELETKAGKDEARSLLKEELNKMQIRERLERIGARTAELDKRLDALEEPFGILPREREAPWVEKPGNRAQSKRD